MSCTPARLLSLINIASVICGFIFYIPVYSIWDSALNEGLESKNVEHLVSIIEKFDVAKSACAEYFLISFSFLMVSAIFLWKRSARLLSLTDIAIVIHGLIFYVPAYSIADRTLNESLESKNVEHLVSIIERLLVAKSAYNMYFLISFAFLMASAIFLRKRSVGSDSH
jgi:hypothetical protein